MCWRWNAAVLPHESGEATAVPQLPLWQRRPHETPTLSKASSAVSGDEEQKDEQLFLELQQRRLPALQLPYVEPSLPRGADNLLLAARPGGRAPLLLVGTSCTSGGLTQRGDKKEKAHQVSLYDVEPQKLGGLSAEPFWSEQSRLLVALCWDHSGGCFAAASQEEDVKGEKVCYINIWSIHDGSERSVGRLVWPPIEQRWELRALCFCGFRLAALAKGTNCSFVSLMDVDTCLEVSRLILPPDYPRYVSQFLLSSPVEGLCMECLALAVDRRVLLWTPGQQDEEFVEVAYWSGCRSPLGTDITLGQDERNKLLVTQVKENGLAHEAGVRGSSGWLLAGWRPLRPSNGYFLHMPHTADSLKRMKDIEKNPEVMLRFQPPNLDIVTLEMDFHVRCTAPFEDGTLLAVGCLKIEDFESVTGLPRKSTPTQGHGKNHAESSMLSIWSLETREFWRAKEVHVTSSISALCWLSRSELVVQLDTEDAVGLVNIESGSLVRRWSCKPWKPKAMVARWCGFSAPQTLGAQDWPPWIAVGLQTGKSPPRSRVAVFAARGGGCVLPAAVISGAESKRKRKLPVVACNESSMIPQFLAVSGIDGTEPSEITFDGSTTASSDPLGKSVRGLSIWQLEDTRARKVCALSCHAQPTSVALSRNLLVACFHQSSILKAYRLLGDGLGCQELCCEDGADNLVAAAARAASDGAADVAAAAGKKSQSSQVVGLACWIRPGEVKKATLSWAKHAEVTALAFLPQRCHLAGLGAGVCCLWNLSTEGVVHCYHEVRVDGENLTCLAVGFDGQLRRVTEEPRAGSPPRARRPSNVGLLTSGEPLPTVQVATSGDSPRVTVVELRTEYRSVWELQDGERQGTRAASPRVLRFTESGRWLAVGDAAGQVHLFKLGRIGQGDGAKVAPAPTHQILSLSGEVVDLVLQGEQLLRATCWHPPLGPRQESDDKFGLEPEGDKVLVYDLMNPSLDFMLPDLHMKAEDTSSALQAQLELMPRLLHQRLPGLGWTLLHCCACRGQAQHARLLVRLSASPFELDAQGRNVLDVALQHNEFGVVEDLMTVLIQYPVTEPGHSWDHLHENSEVLGRALLANSLPSEHLALTRTVVRLLRFRTATLPEFLDSVCWGTPLPLEVTRAGEVQKPLPSRAALQENQMVIRSYTAPVYRPDMPDLEGLVPLSKERRADLEDPQRPVEIRVWFLRGALDKEIGMIRALKESEQEEIMRTKFVQFLLEEQWTNLGWKQFRLELGLYIFSLICWACWCVAGRESCPPPATFGEENASGVAFWIFGVVLIILQVFFLLEELKQFCYELPRGERKGTWANLSVVMNYFSTWNNLDIVFHRPEAVGHSTGVRSLGGRGTLHRSVTGVTVTLRALTAAWLMASSDRATLRVTSLRRRDPSATIERQWNAVLGGQVVLAEEF
ncbi:unnamed protein product [Durusdinium trenchii]|uniref:Uncharacterized protein n=1 Tax=Durusdinium trenchii TaxID=1381693 RepID=A0ABP0NMT5_9DINO